MVIVDQCCKVDLQRYNSLVLQRLNTLTILFHGSKMNYQLVYILLTHNDIVNGLGRIFCVLIQLSESKTQGRIILLIFFDPNYRARQEKMKCVSVIRKPCRTKVQVVGTQCVDVRKTIEMHLYSFLSICSMRTAALQGQLTHLRQLFRLIFYLPIWIFSVRTRTFLLIAKLH